MTEGVRLWLLSVLAASLLCALADALMPKGAVKGVGRLVCGLVLTAVVLSPAVELGLTEGSDWLEEYVSGLSGREEELKNQVDEEMKKIIEQEYEAYILDKAAQLGAECTVRVECRGEGDGVYLPHRVRIGGTLSGQVREELEETLGRELGLSPEEIDFGEEGST